MQKAHGRRGQFAADGSHLSGGMIALMPTEADAKRLALPGGEKAADLHCTLFFLGDDGSVWTPEQRDELEGLVRSMARDLTPVPANIFGAAHWNAGSDNPSWVWSTGDDPAAGLADTGLNEVRYVVQDALESTHDHPELPHQHSPWAAHICAAYTDDLSLLKTLEKRLGQVTFDRIRLSFGDDDRDVPLTGTAVNLTAAAAGLRRDPYPHEEHCDFAEHNRQWEGAVTSASGRIAAVYAGWRAQLKGQIESLADEPQDLTALTVQPGDAADILTEAMLDLARRAGQSLQREAERQGVRVPDWELPDDVVTAAVGGRKLLSSVARMTADLMATSVVQAAKRAVTGLFTQNAPAEDIAREVDRTLGEAEESLTRGPVGTAMSTAQTAGRQAVLEAAPPAQYYASEILDKNTCAPCKAADGEKFDSLEIAIKAYPVMGYKDCVGPRYGNSCRGMIVAMWSPEDEAQTASAAILPSDTSMIGEGDQAVDPEPLKAGKPSKGTKKDRRLTENQYADEGHYGSSNSVSSDPWNGAASAFTDPQYKTACAACDPGEGTPKEQCFLPHHNPGGALNRTGLGAAAGRVGSLSGHSPEAVARAKAHLRGHYRALGEDAPASLAATSLERQSFGVEEGYEEMQFKSDCPPGMKPDEASGKCVPVETMDTEPDLEEMTGSTAPWRGPLTVEGIETGDGREFDSGSLTWAELPLPLRWNKEDSHGGEPKTVAVNVGRIDKIWREDSGLIMGEGVLDLSDDDGRRVHSKIEGKFLRGVSVDVDSVKDADMELVWADTDPDGSGEPDLFAQMFGSPEKVVFHKGRIRAATLVDIPAFAEAYIALLDENGTVVAGGEPIGALRQSFSPLAAQALRVMPPVTPPADWFADPGLSVPTPVTITPDGRVYGHAALWGTCHIGHEGVCVTAPREDDHPYFMTGAVACQGDVMKSVGQITVGTGHAPLSYGHRQASDHYDNTGSAVADVAVGNDGHGIWLSGCIRPGAPEERIHELRAAGQVSGDWRRIGGQLRLVGLLAVNVPGFPVPKLKTKYTSGQQLALVAAGMPNLTETLTEDDLDQIAYRRIMDKLSARVHGEG